MVAARPGPAGAVARVGRLTLALALVGVLTLAAAVVFVVKAHGLRSTDSASNLSLVDTALTNEVISSVSADLNRVFTYDYADPSVTQKAAAELLVGDASSQYKTLADALQSKAAGQQLKLRTTTVLGGVVTLTPDSARLLVFLDQSSTRASDSSSSTAAAQLDVEAVKRDGVWKISEIRPL
jgi:Mce-associated membrane protein